MKHPPASSPAARRWQARAHRLRALVVLLVMLAVGHHAAWPKGFTVSPMSVSLGSGVRSAAVTLRNDDVAPRSFSVRALAWRHDEQGQEQFDETTELIYFPRLITLEPNEQAVVRIGLRQPIAAVERSWRLFVEEMPPPGLDPAGSRVRMRVRFGVPVFAAPVHPTRHLALSDVTREGDWLRWFLRNEGNQHERFEQMSVRGLDGQGRELFAQPVDARYLLAGEHRRLAVQVPASACAQLALVTVQGKTAHGLLDHRLEVAPATCP